MNGFRYRVRAGDIVRFDEFEDDVTSERFVVLKTFIKDFYVQQTFDELVDLLHEMEVAHVG